MQRTFLTCVIVFTSLFIYAYDAGAKQLEIDKSVFATYPSAIMHHGLETAYEEPDPSKLLGFVVFEKGGIPAERARFFITWSDYDYRGVVIHLDENDRITTRRGSPYTYLKRGDVMAVVGYKRFKNTIYLKLLSADVYVPENRRNDKRHSRVSVMLGFKFPSDVIKNDDATTVLAKIGQWLKPFPDVAKAKAYAHSMRGEQVEVKVEAKAEAEDKRIKSLEERIEKARRELDQAERELDDIKEGQ